ncbi:NAD(P)H-hydrate dehydratase [Lacimicrobium alkaliphilum]|uniref:NAD(P)H-hydrate dehydratase n=1 Tax=Lacimicrobium alkaliphilum TaxID=1526571 RepID=UPI001E387C89|nr:NAD(P)H-hydrate dehydratase [Lacimicrobium alkaliphilum]
MNTYNAFVEPASLSHKIYCADEVRRHEPEAARLSGLNMYELMERAGHAAFRQLLAEFPQCHKLLVLCGHGNNGGDGFVLARLAREAGMQVQLVAIGNSDKYSEDTRQAQKRWLSSGGESLTWPVPLANHDVIVDALLGTGVKGEVKSPYRHIIDELNKQRLPVLSIDLPSGLHADTGNPCGIAVNAAATVTFVGIKAGLVTGAGKQHCGKLGFSALGIAENFNRLATPLAILASANQLAPLPQRKINTHKGDYGRLLCIGGNKGMHGAIRLTAEAALRSGAGLVKVLCHPDSRMLVAEGRPELMLADADGKTEALLNWASCIVIGPGLGQDAWAQSQFDTLMAYQKKSSKPMLIDADGLNLLAARESSDLPENTVLTPHPGEAAALLDQSGAEVQADRYDAVNKLTQNYKSTVILKGAGSLVSCNNRKFVLEQGNPGMASGGMGDLLSGLIGGLMAQGMSAANSALTGACIHALAGDLCAEQQGQRGMIASDLIPFIRELVNR